MVKARLLAIFLVAVGLVSILSAGKRPIAAQAHGSSVVIDTAVGAPATQSAPTPKNAPMAFIENVGQFDAGARFQARGSPHGTVHLADDAIWITLLEKAPLREALASKFERLSRTVAEERRRGVNLRLSYTGANPHPRVEGFNRLDTVVSYFKGNDPGKWRPNVPVWGGVRYVDIYPGIDLEITSEGGELAQRFVVREARAGLAVLRDARLRVEGADELSLEANATLQIATHVGSLAMSLDQVELAVLQSQSMSLAPLPTPSLAYDQALAMAGLEVRSPFKPKSTVGPTLAAAGILAGSSDLLYSTFFGGGSGDWGRGLALDSQGNVYLTGVTFSIDMPTTPGSFDRSFGYNADAYVAKLNASGSAMVYATFLGASGADQGEDIAVDASGNAFITGGTDSSDFPTTAGAFQTRLASHVDVFVTRLNPSGTGLVYSTFLGGAPDDFGYGIAVDLEGSAYITGKTQSSNFPTTEGAFQSTSPGGEHAFVTKLNASGSALVYSTFVRGERSDEGHGIAVDDAGNAYVVGETSSYDFPTTNGAFQKDLAGAVDAFAVKLNPTGSALFYSRFLGGFNNDQAYGVSVDGAGNAYVTGATGSSDFPTTPMALARTYSGGSTYRLDAFIAKLNSTGNSLAYSTYLGGTGDDSGQGVAVDAAGNSYVTGYTDSRDFPTTPAVFQPKPYGSYDAFVIKINPTGNVAVYSTLLGGQNADFGREIALDQAGNVYVAGTTESYNFPTTSGVSQGGYGGGYEDAFVAKLNAWDSYKVVPRVHLPVLTKAYQPPVSDDFSNPSSGWPVAEDEIASSCYVDGEYRILVKKAGYIVRAGRRLEAVDFRAEVDARSDSYANGGYGLYFGLGNSGYYVYQIYNGRFWLRRYNASDNRWTILYGLSSTPAIRPGNQTNRLKVVRSGSTIQLYINGQQVGTVSDNVFGRGYVGLAASGYADNFEARFDNFLLVFDTTDATTQGIQTGSGTMVQPGGEQVGRWETDVER